MTVISNQSQIVRRTAPSTSQGGGGAEAAAGLQPVGAGPNRDRAARILLLDDDARIAQALGIRLRAAGYEAVTAPDPAMGVLLAAVHGPDLIITDIWMPVQQGFSFIRRLRSYGLPPVPFIFITAGRKAGLRETALHMGASGFFEKPFDFSQLLAAIRDALAIGPASDVLQTHRQGD